MGGDIELLVARTVGGAPVADLRVLHSMLEGIAVDPALAPSMIDEFPILFVAAALAEGRTVTTGRDELRVKESDRLSVMAAGLQAIGARVEESADGLVIEGTGGDPLAGGATIAGHLDHRICMSFAVAGQVRDRKSVVSGKGGSVRVDLGGRRLIRKQKPKTTQSKNRIQQ